MLLSSLVVEQMTSRGAGKSNGDDDWALWRSEKKKLIEPASIHNVMNISNLFMFFDLTHIKFYLSSAHNHTRDDIPGSILKNQYDAHDDEKVWII